jgi:hypothetical protein
MLDTNVLQEIGTGNQRAADALLKYLKNGTTVYIARVSYDELVTRNTTGHGPEYDQILRELKISVAPPGSYAERLEFQVDNVKNSRKPTDPKPLLVDLTGDKPPPDMKKSQPPGRLDDYSRSVAHPDGSKTPDTNLPGDSFVASQAKANKAKVWTFDVRTFVNKAKRLGLEVEFTPESTSIPSTGKDHRTESSPATARRLLGIPEQGGGGGEKPALDLAKGRARLRRQSGGFVDLGLSSGKGVNKTRVAAGALLAGMVIGAALKFRLACENAVAQENDLSEWERWIQKQQMKTPSMGYLLAVQYSIYTMGPAADPLVKYVHTAGYSASNLDKAAELMVKDPPHNMLARTGEYQPAQYTYPEPMLHWYPPPAPVGADAPNQKLGAILAAMEPPSDDREAFHILDGASMSELLEIYPVLFRTAGYSPLWRSIDLAKIANKNRLQVAVKAVRARQDDLSFGNFCATAGIPLPGKETADYKAIANYFGVGSGAKSVPAWLQGWWTVYDGNYYYYYFSESPAVVYTKTKPADGSAPAPQKPANRGAVALTENGCKITWNPLDSSGSTIETFWQLHAKGNEMNGTSNKYSPLFARKIQ